MSNDRQAGKSSTPRREITILKNSLSFESLPLKVELLKNLNELNFTKITPIQKEALPIVLKGLDLMAQAKTGSGKTATFGLGILNSLKQTDLHIQSLILCPTRELAEQVAKEIRTLARLLKNVRILTICGGTFEIHQMKSLSHGAHIVVGTPGRVLRLLTKKALFLEHTQAFILDEADKMLDMGFHDDIIKIKSHLPSPVHTMLFSATFPKEIKELSKTIQTNPVDVKVDIEHDENIINQTFFEVTRHQDKFFVLLKILKTYRPERLIVFCKTKQITDNVAKLLNKEGVFAGAIHGDLQQNERTNVLTKFSNRSLSVLVATDVAARGIDIQELEAVINYDLPFEPEMYTHRIGRTGRAGKTGLAFTLFLEKERFRLEEIEKITNSKCPIEDLSTLSSSESYDLLPPMKTMYVSGGKKDKLRPGDILGALLGEAKLGPHDVGDISILNVISFVAIKKDSILMAIERLGKSKIKNRKFKVGLA